MGEDDSYRIEARLRQQGRGLAPSPEDIEDLRERQRQADKLLQRPAERAFDTFLATPDEQRDQDGQQQQGEQEPSAGADEAQKPEEAQTGAQAAPPKGAAMPPGAAQRAHQAQSMQAMLQQKLHQQHARAQPQARQPFFVAPGTKPPKPTR